VYGRTTASTTIRGVPLSFEGHAIECVDEFKYLGMHIHSTHSFCAAATHRATAGSKALHGARRRAAELGIQDPLTLIRLFDVMVNPVLSYGAELWGPHFMLNSSNPCDRVHLSFLRQLLGVRQSTPSVVVLAETGRLPLAFTWVRRVARFWNAIMSGPTHALHMLHCRPALPWLVDRARAVACRGRDKWRQ